MHVICPSRTYMIRLAVAACLSASPQLDDPQCVDNTTWTDDYGERCSYYTDLKHPSRACCIDSPSCIRGLLRNCPATCNACDKSPPQPPPPPRPPQLPLPPLPSLILTAGERVATGVEEMRNIIHDASQSTQRSKHALILLPPGIHLRLGGSQIECTTQMRLRIRSTGVGATLDGEGRSRIFYLSGECSIELEGLRLVNGYARGSTDVNVNGGAVLSHFSGGSLWMSSCAVENCSAPEGVFTVAAPCVRRAALTLTPLSRRLAEPSPFAGRMSMSATTLGEGHDVTFM